MPRASARPPRFSPSPRTGEALVGETAKRRAVTNISTADDARRIDYYRDALAGVQECIADGIEVGRYQAWSLLDNYEWASGFRPTFGPVAGDRETFVRTPKPSVCSYGEVARANALPLG